jgi:hypothetical protein
MCQYFESECRLMRSLESRQNILGFRAAKDGLPPSSNPNIWVVGVQKYSNHYCKDWDYGWECWHERVLPWALVRELTTEQRQEAEEKFKKSRELIPEVEKLL